jgi:hypothetical protein
MGGFSHELSDEKTAIMVFLKRYFESAGMPNALWILNESENIAEVRAVIQAYREFYKSHGTHSPASASYGAWSIRWSASSRAAFR